MVIYHGRTSKKSPTIQTQVGRLGDEPPGMSIKIQVSNLCQTTNNTREKLNEPRKNPATFHYTEWLIGIYGLLYFPHNWVVFHPLYTLNNQGPLFHCSNHISTSGLSFERMAPRLVVAKLCHAIFERAGDKHDLSFPRHPVIPPEVSVFRPCFFGVQSYQTSGGGPGCLGFTHDMSCQLRIKER